MYNVALGAVKQLSVRPRRAQNRITRPSPPLRWPRQRTRMNPCAAQHAPMKLRKEHRQSPISNALVAQEWSCRVTAAQPATSDDSPGPCRWHPSRLASAPAGEDDKVPDKCAWRIPGCGGLQPGALGRAPGYSCRRCAARCMARRGSACVRSMLCERRERVRTGCVLSGPGQTLALGLHAHMRVSELGGWNFGEHWGFWFPCLWEGS